MLLSPQEDSAAREQFFRDLERRRTKALVERNRADIEELHAPDYELITPAGNVFSRTQYIEAILNEPFYVAWEIDTIRVRLAPEGMAILRYKALIRFSSGREVLVWHTDAYEQRSGRWQAVWSQATELRRSTPNP